MKPFNSKKHEKAMWQRYYSAKKNPPKTKYKCDLCGVFFEWDRLKTISRLNKMLPPKRICLDCIDPLPF